MNKQELQSKKSALEALEAKLAQMEVELKQIKSELNRPNTPKSWEELKNISGYWVGAASEVVSTVGDVSMTKPNRNVFPSREEAEASIALAQLCQLRDRYNTDEDGVVWKPDWNDEEEIKYIITYYMDEVEVSSCYGEWRVLYFKSEKIAEEFLSAPKIRELIEIAKPLL